MQKYSKNRLIAGTNYIHLPETDSTNSYLIHLLQNNKLPEGTVVSTSHQVAGRGQMGNSWLSEAEQNLTFSMVMYPTFLEIQNQFLLNMAISLGLTDYLKTLLPDVFIKWPNDVYISHKKIAGILVENSISGNTIKQSVIGIGFNVNQTAFPGNLPNPTSLALETGRRTNTEEAREHIMNFLDARLLQLRAGKEEKLREDYHKSMYRLNRPYLFDINGETVEGTIRGVDYSGNLRIEIDEQIRVFAFKEIKYLYEIWN